VTNKKRQKCILNRELYEVVHNKCFMQSVTTVSTRQILFVFIQDKFSGSKYNSVYIKVIGSAILNFSLALSKRPSWDEHLHESQDNHLIIWT